MGVRLYSTLGGTVGYTVRTSRPSRSSLRRFRVSIRRLMPSTVRSSSVKRMGPAAAATMMPMLHLPPMWSSTSLIGHAPSRAAAVTAMFLWDTKVPPSATAISHR